MKLILGTRLVVSLDGEEHRFVLVASGGDGNGRLNVAAPLAVLLGAMAVDDTVKAWTPPVEGAESVCVELVAVEMAQ